MSQLVPPRSSRLAMQVIAWLGVGCVLYAGKAAFVPLIFAVLFSLLLSPLVDVLQRRGVPRAWSAFSSVGLVLIGFALLADVAWQPALKWFDDAPEVLQKVERKVRPLQRVFTRINTVTDRATSLAVANTPNATGSAEPQADALGVVRTVLLNIMTVAILTVFLLVGGTQMLQRCETAYTQGGYRSRWLPVVVAVRTSLSRYLSTLTAINIGLGLATTAIAAAWGLPNPWLWGGLAFLLNFIPYAGPAVTLFILAVVALVSFEGFGIAIGVAASFLLLTTIEGQIVQPLLVGYRLNLNPIALFSTIWLAGWFWGVAGVLLATPLLIALRETVNHSPGHPLLKALLNSRE